MWDADEEVLRGYLASPRAHVRRGGVYLVERLSGWRPLPHLLDLDEPGLRLYVERAIARCVERRWRRSVRPSDDEARRVRELLAKGAIDPKLRASVLQLLELDTRRE